MSTHSAPWCLRVVSEQPDDATQRRTPEASGTQDALNTCTSLMPTATIRKWLNTAQERAASRLK